MMKRSALVGSALAGGPRRSALALAVVLTLAAICLIFGIMMRDARHDVSRAATLSTANLAASLAHDVERNAELLDGSLQAVAKAWVDPRLQYLSPELRDMVLFENSIRAPGFGNVVVLDSSGAMRASSQPDFVWPQGGGNRDFFLVHTTDSEIGLFVSRPFMSQTSKEWVIALSRRINNPDGSFAGVVIGNLTLSYLDSLYGGVELGRDGAAALLRLDGTIVAHVPLESGEQRRNVHALDETFGLLRVAKSGSLEGPSAIDGRQRIISFHRVGPLPLIQVVEASADEVYANWRHKAAALGTGLFVLCLGSLTLLYLLSKELGRRMDAEAELERLASTDPLTALANRRQFEQSFSQEWLRAGRDGSDVALLMVDVDHFKLYNDSHGHLAGDEVLKLVAGCIQGSVHRPGDLPCRIGGEEFAVLLPDTAEGGAHVVAETIRSSIEALNLRHPAAPMGIVTVSIGAASLRPRRTQQSETLIATADEALYKAKHAGRNCVHYDDPPRHIVLVA